MPNLRRALLSPVCRGAKLPPKLFYVEKPATVVLFSSAFRVQGLKFVGPQGSM